MINKFINYFRITSYINLGQKCFFIGTFFLGSALPISIIFYLVSIYISFATKKIKFFKDNYNLILLISSGIMIFNSINAAIILKGSNVTNIGNIIINLFNWIPLFVLYSCSNIYLNNPLKRKQFSAFLIASTFPIILSCIAQYWFGFNGTFKALNGLLVWYIDKINYSEISVSGLFSNRNYTGIWLSSVFAFSLYEVKTITNNWYKKIFLISINFLLIYFTIYTFSRNAILGIIIILIILLNKYKLLVPLFSIYVFANIVVINLPAKVLLESINIKRLFILNFSNFFNFNRVEIFTITSKLISESPIFGWGASSFPKMYELNGGIQSVQHSHNIILELAYNFGLPLSILLCGFVFVLLYKSYTSIFIKSYYGNNILLDKSWFASSAVVTISHLSDITYYDGKVSILIWLLLSGLRCIIEEQNQNLENKKVRYNN